MAFKKLAPLLALLLLAGCPANEPAEVEPPVKTTPNGPGGAANRADPKEQQTRKEAEAERLRKEAERKAADEKAKADDARRAEAEAKEAAEKKAAEEAATELKNGDLRILAGRILFGFSRWCGKIDAPNFVAVKLNDGREDRTHDRPLSFGLGSVRSGARAVMRDALPASWASNEQNGWQGRLRIVTNELLKDRIGGDLFAATPGKLNAGPLKTLLDKLYIAPDKPLLGATAAQVYSVVRQPVRDYTATYALMKPKKAAHTKAYREARAKYADKAGDKYSNDMMEWYYAQSDALQLKEKLEMGDRRGAYLMSGFWMRRFDDGTDKICYDFLRKVTKAYDRKWKP